MKQTQDELLSLQQEELLMIAKGGDLNPSSAMLSRPALGPLLQRQPQAELWPSSPRPHVAWTSSLPAQLPCFPLLLFLFSFHSSFSRSSMSLCIIYHAYVSGGKKDPLQPSSPVTDGPSRFAAS